MHTELKISTLAQASASRSTTHAELSDMATVWNCIFHRVQYPALKQDRPSPRWGSCQGVNKGMRQQ